MPDFSFCHACRRLRPLALILGAGAIAWISLMPSPPDLAGDLLGWDKFQHAAAYGVLTVLVAWVLEPYCTLRSRAWLLGALTAFGYGLGMELAQWALTRERLADPLDLLANASGIVLTYAVARRRLQERRG